jgi:HEAT repeat protein
MAYFPQTTITTDAALRDLTSDKPKVRAAAASALGGAEPERSAEAAGALLRAVDDLDVDVRASAILSLAELGDERAIEPIALRLDDGAPPVRQCAAIALGRMRATAAFDALARALSQGPPDLRFQAATSLVEIDPARAVGPLLAALADADAEVVGAAALALGATGDGEAIEPLAARLDHKAPRTRFDVAYALAGLGDARAEATLVAAAVDAELSWDAIEALEGLGAADQLADLIDRAPDAEHRLRAAAGLLACAPEHARAGAARAALESALSGWRSRRRALALELVEKVGGPWAISALERLAAARPRMRGDIEPVLRALRTSP